MSQTQSQPDDLREFFDLVFSWDGDEANSFKSIHYTFVGEDGETRFAGVAAQTKQQLLQQARFYIRKGKDVYVCLGSQITATELKPEDRPDKWRKANKFATNIKAHKTLYADVDVGKEPEKSYATLDEAYVAVDQFCNAAGLPLPNLRVQSGGGLHCYWVMDRAIHKDEWLPLAEALKAALLRHGLKCDAQCTADMSRILRVPTSFNYKIPAEPRPVNMYDPGPLYTKATLEAALAPYRGMTVPKEPKPGATIHQTEYNKNFSAGVDSGKAAPVDLILLADNGCGVIADAVDTGGAAHNQTLWNLLMLAATFDPDPYTIAHTISDGYPSYSVGETDGMLARKQTEQSVKDMGWPSCAEFHGAAPVSKALCEACPHFGKIKTPFDLRKVHIPTAEEKKLHLPDGYWLDEYGFLYAKVKDKKGVEYEVRLLEYPLIDAGIVDSRPQKLAIDTFIAFRNRRVLITSRQMSNDRDLCNALYDQDIQLSGNQEKHIRSFIVSWMQKLQKIAGKRVRPTALGWDNKTFSYGEKAYTGTGEAAAFYADETVAMKYHPRGDLSLWQDAAEVVLGHPHLEAIVASSFAAPLVALSGYNGLVLSAFSPDSGVGKTTALKIAQSVWGAPEYMMQVNDTENAVMKRIAEVKNLPIYYDELRMPEQLDKVANFVFQVVQGREKQRLNAQSQMSDVRSFKTMMVTCSNKSLTEVMTRANRTTRAGPNRVLEFQVPLLTNSAYDMVEVTNRIARLDENFGRAGEVYARNLARDRDAIQALLTAEMQSLQRLLSVANEDRFWLATMAILIVAAKLAYHYTIIDLDADAIRQLMIQTYFSQQAHRSTNVTNVNRALDLSEILAVFLREHMHTQIIVTDRFHRGPGRPTAKTVEDYTPPGADGRLKNVFGQYALKENILRVDANVFKEYLHKKGYSPEVVIDQLKRLPDFHAGLKRIAVGTLMKYDVPGQVTCFDIPVPDLEEVTSSLGSASPT